MKTLLAFAAAALLALASGCATTPKGTAQNSGPTDTCHVCRYNNDLACLCVKVKDNTPKTEHQGVAFYFCSEDCKTAFLKKPEKYLSKH